MLISLWFGLQQKQNSALFLLQRLEVLFIDTYWSTKCVVLLHLPPSLCHAHLQAFPLSSHIYHAVLTSQNFISFDRVPVCISILGLLLLLSSASWSILFIIIFIFYFAVVFWCFHALVLCCCLFLSAMLHSSVLHLAVHRFLSLSLFFSLFFFFSSGLLNVNYWWLLEGGDCCYISSKEPGFWLDIQAFSHI